MHVSVKKTVVMLCPFKIKAKKNNKFPFCNAGCEPQFCHVGRESQYYYSGRESQYCYFGRESQFCYVALGFRFNLKGLS